MNAVSSMITVNIIHELARQDSRTIKYKLDIYYNVFIIDLSDLKHISTIIIKNNKRQIILVF